MFAFDLSFALKRVPACGGEPFAPMCTLHQFMFSEADLFPAQRRCWWSLSAQAVPLGISAVPRGVPRAFRASGHFTPEIGTVAKCGCLPRSRSLPKVACLPSVWFSALEAGTVCSQPRAR